MLFNLGLIIALFSQVIYAEADRYRIEVLVFSQNLPTSEIFDQTESRIQWPTALTELSAYQQIDDKAFKDNAAALFRDAAYEPIAHLAWVQSTGPGNAILPVHIQSPDGKLDGYVQLRKAQALELIVDLEQKSDRADRSGRVYLYRLNEKRPVKFNEVQYFDHPKIGLLVRVNGG